MRVLYLDNDQDHLGLVKETLVQGGYQIDLANSVAKAVEAFKCNKYDVVLCDVKLDGISGVEFIHLVKSMNASVEVFVLSSSTDVADEVRCISMGVEEYIMKPFNLDTLLMRIEHVEKPKIARQRDFLVSDIENIEVELRKRKVYKNKDLVRLSFLEYQLLLYFLNNRNQTLSRESIIKDVWNEHGHDTNFRTVDTHVKKIRGKLGLDSIVSIRGIGYEWFE